MSQLAHYMSKDKATLVEREISVIIGTLNLDRMLSDDAKIRLFYGITGIICEEYHGKIKDLGGSKE
jgi:hypothetical protein